MNIDELRISSFLRFGYFCDYTKHCAPIDFSRIDKKLYEQVSWDDLVVLGVEKLDETFTDLWQEHREHVVPLSGGLDSRLILGALLERLPAEQIRTYTFGIPGSYDFDIANSIAKDYGTQHLPISLNNMSYSEADELAAAKRTDSQVILFHHPPFDQLDQQFPGALTWSGYVGDVVGGSYLNRVPSDTPGTAQVGHLRNRVVVTSVNLSRFEDHEFLECMDELTIDPELLTYDEQVLFNEAAPKFTAPLVLFPGYDFVAPFINTPWMDFILSVPNRFRLDQKLMFEIGRRAFPRLFNLPSKNRLGHTFDTPDIVLTGTFWLNRIRKAGHQFFPGINWPNFQYNDFNEAIRSNPSLRQLVRESIDDLRGRGICDWVDFDGIWRRHDWRIRNHGDALIILASLELNLKAKEMANLE